MTILVTVDELGALHRLTGLWRPGFAETEAEIEVGPPVDAIMPTASLVSLYRSDASVLRGLALRGHFDLAAARVTGPLAGCLAPHLDADLRAEVTVEWPGGGETLGVSRGRTGAVGLLRARPNGLVEASIVDRDVAWLLADLGRVAEVTEAADGPMWRVDSLAHIDADELALAGEADKAIAALVDGGAPPDAAAGWVAAVTGRRCAAAISVARQAGGARIEAGELRWLVGPDGAGWRVAGDGAGRSELSPVDAGQLREAVAVLCQAT